MEGDSGLTDDSIIEGNYAVVKTQELPTTTYQVTIKAQTDHKLAQIENVIVNIQKIDKLSAWAILIKYLIKRTNRIEVRLIFEASLMGIKPIHKKLGANKHEFLFNNVEEAFIEKYSLTFIEV